MVSITACKQASGAETFTPKTLNDTALEQLVIALGTEFLHLRPFTLRAGCSLPYFREWDLQILSPGSSPPSIFFHSWLSTLFCLLLIVTVLCRLLSVLLPRHFCSSLALLPSFPPLAPHPSSLPMLTSVASASTILATCHKLGPPYHLQKQKQEKAIWEKHFISHIAKGQQETAQEVFFFFPAELQRKLNSHLWGGGAVKAVKFGPIRYANEELRLHQS